MSKEEGENMAKLSLTEFVTVMEKVETWEQAIEKAAFPLLQAGYITQGYIEQMIENVKKWGPYIVVAPQVALPHAQSECGALKTGVSVMKLMNKVSFSPDQEVQLLVVLSAEDGTTHMEVLSEIVDLLMDEQKMIKIFGAKSKEELVEVLS